MDPLGKNTSLYSSFQSGISAHSTHLFCIMTMNNGPASVACLVGVVPKRTQLKQKIPFGNCRESSSLARRDMLWSYCVCLSYGCVAVSERLPIIILQRSCRPMVTMGTVVTDVLRRSGLICLVLEKKGRKVRK